MEGTFAASTHVARDLRRLPDQAPPLIVLIDRRCTYTFRSASSGRFWLGRRPVAVSAAEHGGRVTLHDGARLAVGGTAFTSLYGANDRPFFFAALPTVWAAGPKYRDDPEDWVRFLMRVMLHELMHTRQLDAIMHALQSAGAAVRTATLDDDLIQRRFESDSAFARAQRAETDLPYDAASATDAARRLERIGRALAVGATGTRGTTLAGIPRTWRSRRGSSTWKASRSGRRTPTCEMKRDRTVIRRPRSTACEATAGGGRRITASRAIWHSTQRFPTGSDRSFRRRCGLRRSAVDLLAERAAHERPHARPARPAASRSRPGRREPS